MPAADRLDAAIARMAGEAEKPKDLLVLAEAYDKLKHAGTGTQETVLASGADMLDGTASFLDPPEDRMGFKPVRRTMA
jgi:hypothetical protein